jgi:Uri superfamily endonuclease
MTNELPSTPGTYAILLVCRADALIEVGRLGTLRVQPGFFVYVGSAMGPGGLAARVGRHLRLEKRLHWHVDILRAVTQFDEVWYAEGGPLR